MRRSLLLSLILLASLPAGAPAEVGLHKVGDFSEPVQVTGAPGDGERLFVVEQPGTIKVVRNGVASEFANLITAVEHGGEQGLLSMAFAPDFATSRMLYVYYTEAGGQANRIDELRAPTSDAVDPESRRLVLSIPHTTAANHNGGQIQFGPDGMLYLATGDGGNTPAAARDPSSLLGKLLRIDPRGDEPGEYGVPAENPFVGAPGRDEIWSLGLRNPFRFSFDRLTGDLVLGDVGEGTTEEINFLPNTAGRGRGADFGWNVCEGSWLVGSTTQPCSVAGSVLPAIEKLRDEGYRSIIPGYVVRDPSLPSLQGRLVYGDYFVDRPRSALLGPGGATDDRDIGPEAVIDGLAGFGEDAGGCVYAASRSGPVYRLVEEDTQIPCPARAGGTPPGSGAPPAPPPGSPPGSPPLAIRTPPLANEEALDDRRGPAVRARAKRRQRLLRLGGAVVYVRCDERCRITAAGTLRIGRRRFALQRMTGPLLETGRRLRLELRLSDRGLSALRRAIRSGRRPNLSIRIRARDVAGNLSTVVQRTVRTRL
ncbi:MAG TPA: PQQ-dependent sugar dehydrogenase [Thermoleophilaceae bacterium]|nr:PQQ-dependent sugar dehydrogenase [Thermoleophilaceae bacterium]